MAVLSFDGIGISGLASAVPKNIIINEEYTEHFSSEEVKEIVEKTGIKERRFAPKGMTASDLCYAAANALLEEQKVDRSEIDVLIFVSQTPDYRMPASAIVLQERLGLSQQTAAFDVSIGCSGYVYGLSLAYSFAQQSSIRKVLLLDGETRSRVYSAKDRKTAFLFGDGGTATLIEKQKKGLKSSFNLNSDGGREHLIKMDAGGYRNPSSVETLKEKVVDEFGNIRSDEHGYMNGSDVFSFVLREIPRTFKSTLANHNVDKDDIDKFYFHQANKFMNDYLGKKLKLPADKAPQCLDKFGNTSSVSIPLTISSDLGGSRVEGTRFLLSGFGVGMSWATAILELESISVVPLIEV